MGLDGESNPGLDWTAVWASTSVVGLFAYSPPISAGGAPWRLGHLIRLVGISREAFWKASPRPAPPPLASLYSSVPFLSSLAALLLFASGGRPSNGYYSTSPLPLFSLGFLFSAKIGVNRINPMFLLFVPSSLFGPIKELHKQFFATLVPWWQMWYESSTGYWLP